MIEEFCSLIGKKGILGYTQPKEVVPDYTFSWWLALCKKKLSYQLILYKYIDDQRIL